MLDFGLSLNQFYIHQDARVVAPRALVCGSVSHSDSYMLASQIFVIIVSRPKILNLSSPPVEVEHSPHLKRAPETQYVCTIAFPPFLKNMAGGAELRVESTYLKL